MKSAPTIGDRVEHLRELRKAIHNVNRSFQELLCPDSGEPETKLEEVWVLFLWELDETLRAEERRRSL